MPDRDDFRLPRTVEPVRYELTITPDLQAATFSTQERITIRVLEPVDQVILNAAELKVLRAEMAAVGDTGDAREAAIDYDQETERLIVTPPHRLESGEWQLGLWFEGTLNDKLRGFYRSTFRDEQGNEQVIATTQFEPADARRAFPCWDEPDRKAIFSVTLVVEDGLTAVSNGRVVSDEVQPDGRHRVTFADTMPMSTYLVAFVVGPLETTAPVDVDGVPIRLVSVAGKGHLTSFALEMAAHALRFFTRWFGIPYPSDKLDHIAIPDFAFGAMENLGAVTYRESVLLVDPATATRDELERVAEVIAHETAHMWFGDLVTMKWWNGIWLNEAFATFMEMLAVDDFRPDWERWSTFAISREAAMAIDGLAATRPIEFPVGRPDEAEGMFDLLTYQKGAGVLRMLERFLGGETFRRGINRYLEGHAYGNTETTDLWDAIEISSGEPARAIMDSWIYQGGHPLVTAQLAADGLSLHLSQRRFLYLDDPAAHSARWQIPLRLRLGSTAEDRELRFLMTGADATVELPVRADWVHVNAGGSGVFRSAYDHESFRRMTQDLRRLDPLERISLLNDTWAATLAGITPVADYLLLVSRFGSEDNPRVWDLLRAPLRIVERSAGARGRDTFRRYVRELAGPALEAVGWDALETEPESRRVLRATLVNLLGTIASDPATIERAGAVHRRLLEDRHAVEPNLAGAVIAVVSESGGDTEYRQFLERWRHPATPQEEIRYLYALAGFPSAGLMAETMHLASTEARSQNAPFLIAYALSNRDHGAVAWDYVEQHWEELLARLPDSTIPRMLSGIVWLWDEADQLAPAVDRFLAAHPFPPGEKTIAQLRERLRVNAGFARQHADAVRAALAEPGTDPNRSE